MHIHTYARTRAYARTHIDTMFTCMHTLTLLHLPPLSRSSGISLRLSPRPLLAFKALAIHLSPQIPVSRAFEATCACNDMRLVTEIMIGPYTHSSLSSVSALTVTYATSSQSKAPHFSLLWPCPYMGDITDLSFLTATPHNHFRQEVRKSVQSKL